MNDVGTLHSRGFTDTDAHQLWALKQRYQRGEFSEELTTTERRRLEFIRWLVTRGRLIR